MPWTGDGQIAWETNAMDRRMAVKSLKQLAKTKRGTERGDSIWLGNVHHGTVC